MLGTIIFSVLVGLSIGGEFYALVQRKRKDDDYEQMCNISKRKDKNDE